MLGPESQDFCSLNRCFGNHISEAYHALPSADESFRTPKSIENSHLLLVLRSAICMWPYALIKLMAKNNSLARTVLAKLLFTTLGLGNGASYSRACREQATRSVSATHRNS